MTVPSPTSRSLFTGNGGTTEFTPEFYFRFTSELVVTLTPSGGTPVIQNEGIDYSVALPSGVGQEDGLLTMAVAPVAASELKIERTVPFTQQTSLRQAGEFDPVAHEDQFDELTFQTQQLKRELSDIADGSLTGDFVAGNGLSMAGTTLNVGAGVGIQSNADDIEVIFGDDQAEMNGAASDASGPYTPGNIDKAARIDHQHQVITGTPSALAVGQAMGQGNSTTLSRSNHQHAVPVAAPVAVDAAAAVTGASGNFSDANHKHQVSVGSPVQVAAANADGVATTLARSDHAHSHGNQLGAALHAVVGAANGFMSAADKVILDALAAPRTHVLAACTSAQSIPNNTFPYTVVVFNSETRDPLNEYNSGTGFFTAVQTGYYLVSAGVWLDGAAADVANTNLMQMYISGPGGQIRSFKGSWQNGVDSLVQSAEGSAVFYLVAGQTIDIEVFHFRSTGAARTVNNNSFLCVDRLLT